MSEADFEGRFDMRSLTAYKLRYNSFLKMLIVHYVADFMLSCNLWSHFTMHLRFIYMNIYIYINWHIFRVHDNWFSSLKLIFYSQYKDRPHFNKLATNNKNLSHISSSTCSIHGSLFLPHSIPSSSVT